MGVGEAGDPHLDGLLPPDLGGEVGEVVEVLPPHHPDPDYPVPHLLRRHLPRRRRPPGLGSLNPDGFGAMTGLDWSDD